MMCEQISSKQVTTRKPHRCFGCCQEIPKGVTVSADTMRGDCSIYTLYLCDPCTALEQELAANRGPYHVWDEPYSEGGLAEAVELSRSYQPGYPFVAAVS